MRHFNGVATKYLDSYLGWHRINDREDRTLDASRMLAAAWVNPQHKSQTAPNRMPAALRAQRPASTTSDSKNANIAVSV
jgi:hypothetical protein